MHQVDDNIDLLELMIKDQQEEAPDKQADGKWAPYSDRFLEYLRTHSLRDFRSLRGAQRGTGERVLYSFGAVDLMPQQEGVTPDYIFKAALTQFSGNSALSIRDLEASRVGNPEGFFAEGKFYTLSWINFYCRYAFVSRFLDFNKQTIVEVGPGSGKQAEMLKRAHPGLTVVLFDLPTQLYVCNQYLSKVFQDSGDVITYDNTRNFRSFDDIVRGKINILPHWKFSILEGRRFDLLWNAASFQEMKPTTAAEYLRCGKGAKNMYLLHTIKYEPHAQAPGRRGVISNKHLSGFVELDREWARVGYTPMVWDYFDSFWVKEPFLDRLGWSPSRIGQALGRRFGLGLKQSG